MDYPRLTWQHKNEYRSESQLSDVFHSVGWIAERLKYDYGEDLMGRPFENGNPTGEEFFIQLKGTDDEESHFLADKKWYSYSIDLVNLRQWYSYTLPVVLILWDITTRTGYWTHVQPFIEKKLVTRPKWLENTKNAKKPKRNVRIPTGQFIRENDLNSLKILIKTEWGKIKRGKQHFEILYKAQPKNFGDDYNPNLPLAIEQQLMVIEIESSLAANPNKPKECLDLAAIYYDINDLNKAFKAINCAWELDPNNKDIQQTRACILAQYAQNAQKNGNPPSMLHEAIALFQATISESNISIANYNIGNCYSALEEHKKAINYYDIALSKNPQPKQAASIWTNRGNSADDIDNRDDAIDSFKKAIELNDNLWNAHASWAALEVRYGNYENACHHFQTALRHNPTLRTREDDNLMYWYSYSMFQVRNYRESLQIVNEFLSIQPVHKEAKILKTRILYYLRRDDGKFIGEASSFFQKMLLDDPSDFLIRSELNFIYLEQNRLDERRKLLEETVLFDDAPAMALYDYALLLEEDGEVDKAINYLEQAVKKEKNHGIVHNLARLYHNSNCYEEAVKYYNLALEGVTDSFSILEELANCYHFLNDYRNSSIVLAQAILQKPANILLRNNLAFALNELGVDEWEFTIFLTEKIYNEDELSEDEIKEKLIEFAF